MPTITVTAQEARLLRNARLLDRVDQVLLHLVLEAVGHSLRAEGAAVDQRVPSRRRAARRARRTRT